MKNKKGMIELSIGGIVLIFLAMVIVILGLVVINRRFNEPHFKMEKNNCWNESKQIGEKHIAQERNCTYTLEKEWYNEGKKYDIKGCYISSEWENRYDCDTNHCEFDVSTTYADGTKANLYTFIIKKEDYSEEWIFVEPIFKIEQTCEPVEVDEIEIYDRLIYYNINDYIPATLFANKSYTLFTNNEDYWFYENYNKISKSDLTLDWLDENCECIERACDNSIKEIDGKRVKCADTNFCQKYKCGEYQVEIK